VNLCPDAAAADDDGWHDSDDDDDDDDDELVSETSEWGRFTPVLCSGDVTAMEFLTFGTATYVHVNNRYS